MRQTYAHIPHRTDCDGADFEGRGEPPNMLKIGNTIPCKIYRMSKRGKKKRKTHKNNFNPNATLISSI